MSLIQDRRRAMLAASGKKAEIYGVAIDLNNSDPETAVTYTDLAVGMTPGSAEWDNTPIFSGIRPCKINNSGEVLNYLNPNNFEQDVNGNTVSLNSNQIMIEFPKMGYKIETVGNILKVQVTTDPNAGAEGFKYYAFTRQTEGDCEHLYVGAYDSMMVMGRLASVLGFAPSVNNTIGILRNSARVNGEGWDLLSFYPLTLLQCLYLIRFKSLNSQAALGNGYVNASSPVPSGRCTTYGMYYGASDTQNDYLKCFGIEHLWGNISQFIDGIIKDGSGNILTAFDDFNDNGDGYVNRGGAVPNSDGYMITPQGTNELGFLGRTAGGSETTFFCDYGFGSATVFSFGGNYTLKTYAGRAGIFNLGATGGISGTANFLGARLMYLKAGQ